MRVTAATTSMVNSTGMPGVAAVPGRGANELLTTRQTVVGSTTGAALSSVSAASSSSAVADQRSPAESTSVRPLPASAPRTSSRPSAAVARSSTP